ncbi:hypothetical protein FHG87_002042 [Trinorchestia longiramus]|nr:hypothetical protein FHG87_002042 [Trinorchestia longiramus]
MIGIYQDFTLQNRHRKADGKSKKAGSHSMAECTTCRMWVDLKSCKSFTEMSESEWNKLVFDCWKCMVDVKDGRVN